MTTTRIDSSGRSSAIVINNGVVYLSGQVAEDPEADVQDQTRSTLARVDALLEKAGTDKTNLISATIYLRDIANHFALMNEVWNDWVVDGHQPVRACVQAHMARPALLVEISIIAALPE